MLLADLVHTALDRGARHLTLEVRVGNDPALALYRRFGLAPVGVRRNYYPVTGDDALVMWARDIDSSLRRTAGRHRASSIRRLRGRWRATDAPGVGAGPAVTSPATATPTRVLGIETSCDETAAAVVDDGSVIVVLGGDSQIDLHARYGGVVPELAGRAHVELLTPVLAEALDRPGSDTWAGIDAVAVTSGRPHRVAAGGRGRGQGPGPGLGAYPWSGSTTWRPICSPPSSSSPISGWPLVVLLVSGGHTLLIEVTEPGHYRLLGRTIDDAAGEAFDKVARFLGLGYPGGPAIDRVAERGDPDAFAFPRSLSGDGYDFSFSGIKTRWSTPCASIPRRRPPTWPPPSARRWSTCW